MFGKLKSSGSSSNVLLANPIRNFCEFHKQTATAGPEHVWRIYEAYSKEDGKEVSVFLFDKRSVEKPRIKPKRKETVTEILRKGAQQMQRFPHPKILQVYKIEECTETLAFASEPVLASLANVLAHQEQQILNGKPHPQTQGHRPVYVKEYELLDIEIKYGLLQITEALLFLHGTPKILHRNVCPSNIIITKRGTWKLAGFEFAENINEVPLAVQSWTTKLSKMVQPYLDYIAPEIQKQKLASYSSDMYSLGMTICAIFNGGRPLIQANHNCSEYLKQLERLEEQVDIILPLVALPLREAVSRLLHKDPDSRPTPQVLLRIKYFQDPLVHALQFLDVSKLKETTQKEHFYTTTLRETLPYMPKKLLYQHIWWYLQMELQTQNVLPAVLQPVLYIIQESTREEYEQIIFPTLRQYWSIFRTAIWSGLIVGKLLIIICQFHVKKVILKGQMPVLERQLFSNRKSIQGTVTLLENLHIILQKTPEEYIDSEVLQMLYASFDNSTMQVQTAAFVAVTNVDEYLDDEAIRTKVLPKLLQAFENGTVDERKLMKVVYCILNRLEKQKIIDYVLPLLCKVKLQEPEIVIRVVDIYKLMLANKKYGLSVNWMATRAMPSLLPQAVNPALNLEQFISLFQILQEMLNQIERNQRNKLTLDNLSLPSPERYRPFRHQHSTDNMHIQPFNIPNLRIDQRKTSSAEDMARKNSMSKKCQRIMSTGGPDRTASAENMARKNSMFASLGGWFTSTVNDSNFLRVHSAFTGRRLSDNTLMTPKIRVAPSCASSPGGTPGGGLPTRRHSTTEPPERRGSTINLSPPTGGGMPITSNSVPYLLSSSMNSIRGSRHPSISSTSSQQGSRLLQQVGSSMYQFFNR